MDIRSPAASEPSPATPTVEDLAGVIAHLQEVMEQQRVVLSRVLHDELGGLLVSAVMDVGWVEQRLTDADVGARLKRARQSLSAAIDLKRNLTEELRPSLLDNFGLFAAFRWHVKHTCSRAGIACTDHYPDEELTLRPAALAALFRIMQETLAVILTEEGVVGIDVGVRIDGDRLILTTTHTHQVSETIDMFINRPTYMQAIALRVAELGGQLTIERQTAASIVAVALPLAQVATSHG